MEHRQTQHHSRLARVALLRLVRVALLIAALSAPSAHALDVAFRGALWPGAWTSSFRQTGYGHDVKIAGKLGAGIGASAGVRVEFAFVEYELVMASQFRGTAARGPASFASLASGVAGVAVPILPIDIYGGAGTFGTTVATDESFYGPSAIVGMAAHYGFESGPRIGIRAEYRRAFLLDDAIGRIPSSVTTQADLFLAGLLLQLGR